MLLRSIVFSEAVRGPRAGDGGGLSRRKARVQFQGQAFGQSHGGPGVQVQLRGHDFESRRCRRRRVRAATAACCRSDRLATGVRVVSCHVRSQFGFGFGTVQCLALANHKMSSCDLFYCTAVQYSIPFSCW